MSDAFFLFDGDEVLGDWWGGHSAVGPPAVSALCGLTDCETGPPGVSGLTLSLEGSFYDLGDARLDADGDGTSDSVTLSDDDGLTVYTDSDGDGMVDRVTTVRFDGGYASWAMNVDERSGHGDVAVEGISHEKTQHRKFHDINNEISYQIHSLGGVRAQSFNDGERNHSKAGGDETSPDDERVKMRGSTTLNKRYASSKQCLDTWTRWRWECVERGNWDKS
ncbi:DUF6802 family protein [Corynebacterium sp. SFY-M4]|uniref:DUF6802 family protein n=1 Tax=Corynebacterium sp. SFY-M4 TaxID=3092265 RepID=UPI00298DC4C9|nr:DUF6802 family protein [Corynebacterium sp. SFY-M4]